MRAEVRERREPGVETGRLGRGGCRGAATGATLYRVVDRTCGGWLGRVERARHCLALYGIAAGVSNSATDTTLIGRVKQAIDELLSTGVLPALARAGGLTSVCPRQPDVLEPPPLTALRD